MKRLQFNLARVILPHSKFWGVERDGTRAYVIFFDLQNAQNLLTKLNELPNAALQQREWDPWGKIHLS